MRNWRRSTGGAHAPRRVLAVVAAVAAGASMLVLGTPAPASAACTVLEPALRDITVNQGLGTYDPLVRGKETLVRAYLSLPTCAVTGNAIEVRGGTLNVSVGGAAPVAVAPISVVTPFDQVTPYASAPAANDPADLIFAVPGSALLPAATGSAPVTFTVTINYAGRLSTKTAFPTATSSVTYPATPRTVGPQTNAVRMLVVPLVDRTQPIDGQWPTGSNGATAAIARGMVAAGRALPVRDGVVADLAATTGGIRYRVLDPATLGLDIGPSGLNLLQGGRLCNDGVVWDGLQDVLAARLQAWNSENPTQQADRIVGAVSENLSLGGASGCVEGIADIGSAELYVRALPEGTSPSQTGAVLTHELFHTLGGVPADRDDNGYHSTATQADAANPNRAFNVTTRAVLGTANRTVMRSSTGWNEYSTVFERLDYELARCLLTPGSTGCPAPGSVGSAAVGFAWAAVGRTDGTPGGTVLSNSYLDSAITRTTPAAAGSTPFHVRQLDANGVQVGDVYVQLPREKPNEGNVAGFPTTGPVYSIDLAVDAPATAKTFVLMNGTTELARRSAGSQLALGTAYRPLTATGTTNFTATAGDDTQPSLSPDGRYLAWTTPAGIVVRPVDRSTPASAPVAGSQPALANGRLAFREADGSLSVATITTSGGVTAIGTPQTVYRSTLLDLGASPDPASHPSWSPDGQSLVAAYRDDIWRFTVPASAAGILDPHRCSLPGTGCTRLITSTSTETNPSVASDGVIAFERDGGVTVVGADLAQIGAPIAGASAPSWGGTTLAFARGGAIWTRQGGNEARLTPVGADTSPALSANATLGALQRAGTGQDVFLLTIGQGPRTVPITMSNPATGRVDVLEVCPDGTTVAHVLSLPVTPTGTTSGTLVVPDHPSSCGGVERLKLSDGVSVTYSDSAPASPAPGNRSPVVAWYAPTAELNEGQSIALRAAGSDEEDGALTPAYHVSGPGTELDVPAGTTDLAAPAGGWTPGTYTLTACVTDSAGATTCASRTLVIFEDQDHDGRRTGVDTGCNGESLDQDAGPADSDGDGILDDADTAKCTPATNSTVDFDPNTLNPASSGTPVTVYVSCTPCNLATTVADTVAITSIGGYPVNIPASSSTWSSSQGRATFQFSRPDFNAFVMAHPGPAWSHRAGRRSRPDRQRLHLRGLRRRRPRHQLTPHPTRGDTTMHRSLKAAVCAVLAGGALALVAPAPSGAAPKPDNCQGALLKRAEPAPVPGAEDVDNFASPADIIGANVGAVSDGAGGLLVNATLLIDQEDGLGYASCSRLSYSVVLTRIDLPSGTPVGPTVTTTIPGDGSTALTFPTVALPAPGPADTYTWGTLANGGRCYRISAQATNPGLEPADRVLDNAPDLGSGIRLCTTSGPSIKMR